MWETLTRAMWDDPARRSMGMVKMAGLFFYALA